MKSLNQVGRFVCVILLLATTSCSRSRSDAPQPQEPLPPIPISDSSIPDNSDLTDTPPSQDPISEADDSSQPTPPPPSVVDISTPDSPPRSPEPTTTTSPEIPIPIVVRAPNVSDTLVSIHDFFVLKMKVENEWEEFSYRLPNGDLSGLQVNLLSTSTLQTTLKCENQDCTTSKIWISDGEKTTTVQLQQIMLFALPGELQRNCEIPVFFDYELRTIPNIGQIQKNIAELKKVSLVLATFSHITLWNRQEFKSTRLDLFSGNRELMTLNEENIADRNIIHLTPSSKLSAQTVSYGLIGQGPRTSIDHIKFHFSIGHGSTKELCYHLPLIPEVIRSSEDLVP